VLCCWPRTPLGTFCRFHDSTAVPATLPWAGLCPFLGHQASAAVPLQANMRQMHLSNRLSSLALALGCAYGVGRPGVAGLHGDLRSFPSAGLSPSPPWLSDMRFLFPQARSHPLLLPSDWTTGTNSRGGTHPQPLGARRQTLLARLLRPSSPSTGTVVGTAHPSKIRSTEESLPSTCPSVVF